MKEPSAAEGINAEEEKLEGAILAAKGEDEQTDGSPWLLEWFPGFDIPIGLEGRAYLRRLLNHRRAENPTACETLLAAHGIKLGRGVPGHTSNWGSMKVRELLHAAYLLGCWSAVERLCINFCHANGLKTEWIRELKAKGGKQSVTLANLQNYRKKNREKKRPLALETREKKNFAPAGLTAPASAAANKSTSCTSAAVHSLSGAATSSAAAVSAATFCKHTECERGDDLSCSSFGSITSQKNHPINPLSCEPQTSCLYTSSVPPAEQPARLEASPNLKLEYTSLLPSFYPSTEEGNASTQETITQESRFNHCGAQVPVQVTLSPVQTMHAGGQTSTFFPNTEANGALGPEKQIFTAAGDLQILPAAHVFPEVVGKEFASAPSTFSPPGTTTPVPRMRRPKRRRGRAKPSGPRKRRQTSSCRLAADSRTGSFTSVSSCDYPAAHISELASAGQFLSEETKDRPKSGLIFPTSVHSSAQLSTCERTARDQTYLGPPPLQGQISNPIQRPVRLAAAEIPISSAESAISSTESSACLSQWDSTRPNLSRHDCMCCGASVFSTDSSDNGSSETESLYSRMSISTTSSFSDSDCSLVEDCNCSSVKMKQVNFAGKKPAFTCHTTCPAAAVTEAPPTLLLTSAAFEEHTGAAADIGETLGWRNLAAVSHAPHVTSVGSLPTVATSHRSRHSSFAVDSDASTAGALERDSFTACGSSVSTLYGVWNTFSRLGTPKTAGGESHTVHNGGALGGNLDTVLLPPQTVTPTLFVASSQKTESKIREHAERVLPHPPKRNLPVAEWKPSVVHTPACTEFAALAVDRPEPFLACETWKASPQAAPRIHQGEAAEMQCTDTNYMHQLQGEDESGSIYYERADYRNTISGGTPDTMGIKAFTRGWDCGSPSELQQLNRLQEEAENKPEPEYTAVLSKWTGTNQETTTMARGPYTVKKGLPERESNTRVGRTAHKSFPTDENIHSGAAAAAAGRLPFYKESQLPSTLSCAGTVADSLLSFTNMQSHTVDISAAPALERTDVSQYIPSFCCGQDSCIAETGCKGADTYTRGDFLKKEMLLARTAESSAVATSPTSAAAASPEAAGLTRYSPAGGIATTFCASPARRGSTPVHGVCTQGNVLMSRCPGLVPPHGEAQPFISATDSLTTDSHVSQAVLWGMFRSSSSAARAELAALKEVSRGPLSDAEEKPSPAQPENTALPSDWEDIEPNGAYCPASVVSQAPADSATDASLVESRYKITCGESSVISNAMLELTLQKSALHQ